MSICRGRLLSVRIPGKFCCRFLAVVVVVVVVTPVISIILFLSVVDVTADAAAVVVDTVVRERSLLYICRGKYHCTVNLLKNRFRFGRC